jgi:hypothetical protein
VQLPIRDSSNILRLIPFPDNRYFISTMEEVTVEAVLTDVKLSTYEPLNVRINEIPGDNFVPQRVPLNKGPSLLVPKLLWMLN